MQSLVQNEKKWAVGLCDRGTLDGVAYWPDNESEFYKGLSTTRQTECAKYLAVIHLNTPALLMHAFLQECCGKHLERLST